ncbi:MULTISPECIES: MFS transporter [Enterobacteriaceae]|uniref:MFS transporter n=1 Tax=Enterobacter hormaechei TaxID=158836 RepID=A0A9X7KXZ3_9ENTR|nr:MULTISPECIES: MFS transporter [Enterobacteriaceae]HEE9937015.1 MFS transporter [Citrobacter braakii]MBD5683282.1 MFS transporter [Citrobacter freundii]MDM2795941.1 MFS transporter [Citrobacter sp. Cpo131]MDM2889812.1 MFS transporter [Citrobacter sp. Cpo060]MDT7067954.1 MFS transporter [Citrobacter freundii]
MSSNTTVYQGNARLTLGIVLLVLTFWMFAQSMQAALIPIISKDFGIIDDPAKMDLLNFAASITPLFSAACIVAAGGLADRFGRMRFAFIGVVLSVLGSVIVALSSGVEMLIIGRGIQGISAACIMPSTIALMKTYFEGKRQATALTWWSVGSWGGSGFCAILVGVIEPSFGWQSIYWISAVVAIVGLLLMAGTPESKAEPTDKKFDTQGTSIFIASLIALVLAVSKGRSWGYDDIRFLSTMVFAIIGLISFYFVEKRAPEKGIAQLVDFSLFRSRGYFGATLSNFLLNAIAGAMVIVNIYMIQGRGLGTSDVATMTITYAIAVLALLPVGQKILFIFGGRLPMIIGTIITFSGVILMSLTSIEDLRLYKILVMTGYAMFGLGLGIYATPSTFTAVSSAPQEKAAVAAGIYKLASSLGGAIGVALSLAVYSAFDDIHKAGTAGLWLNVGFGILALISILFIIPRQQKSLKIKTA